MNGHDKSKGTKTINSEKASNVLHMEFEKRKKSIGKNNGSGDDSFSPELLARMDFDLHRIAQPAIKNYIEVQLQRLISETDTEKFYEKWGELKTANNGLSILVFFVNNEKPGLLGEYLALSSAPQEEKDILKEWFARFSPLADRLKGWEIFLEGRLNPWESYKMEYVFIPITERVLFDVKLYGVNGPILHIKDHVENFMELVAHLLDHIATATTLFSGKDAFIASEVGKELYEDIIAKIEESLKSIKAQIAAK